MNTKDMFATFLRDDTNMVIFESIDDPNGDFGVPADQPAPIPAPIVLAPASIQGIMLARVHGIDEDVHAFVRDVQVGEETLVVNPILNAEDGTDAEDVFVDVDDGIDEDCFEDAEANADVQNDQVAELQGISLVNPTSLGSITPDGQLGSAIEEIDNNLQDQISITGPGIGTTFTATIGPFDVAPLQPANTAISTTTPVDNSTRERLVKPALEAVNCLHTASRLLEKADEESAEEPAPKRQKDPASTLSQAGPSEAQA